MQWVAIRSCFRIHQAIHRSVGRAIDVAFPIFGVKVNKASGMYIHVYRFVVQCGTMLGTN
jgi:hypothetical protein